MKKIEVPIETVGKNILADAIVNNIIEEKKNSSDVLDKIITGIINISSIHGRFATAVIPMLKAISDEKNTTSKEISTKAFSLFVKKYARSNLVVMNTNPSLKETLKDVFVVPIRTDNLPLLNGEDECIALSLRDLSSAYEKFDDGIRKMVLCKDINNWKTCFKQIQEDIELIYDEIRSLEDDLSISYLNSDNMDYFNSDSLSINKNKVSIRKIDDIIIYIKDTFKCLDDTYLKCIKLQYIILSTINIADPLNLESIADDITIKPENMIDFAALNPLMYKSKTDIEEDDDF